MSKFVIRDVPSGIKFDLKAVNGQTILTSEVYESRAACAAGIASVQKNAPKARIADLTGEDIQAANPKFEVYQDRAGAFRFRLKARNGKIIGISDGYTTKAACLSGIESVKQNALEESLWTSEKWQKSW